MRHKQKAQTPPRGRHLSWPEGITSRMKIDKKFRKDLNAWRWGFDVTIAGQRIRRHEWPRKREAVEALASLHTHARAIRYGLEMPQPVITLGDLDHALNKRPLLTGQRYIFEKFLDAVGEDASLSTIRRNTIGEFRDDLKAEGLADSTVNTYMDYLCALLNRAPDLWPDLDWEPPRLKRLKTPSGRTRVLNADEIARLCATFRADTIPREHGLRAVITRADIFDFFRCALLTGAREGEIFGWSEKGINRDWQTIKFYRQKTKTEAVLPLTATLEAILRSRKPGAGGKFFAGITTTKLQYTLNRVAEAASIMYGRDVADGWVAHSLRHTAATVLEELNVSRSTVAAILGHSARSTTARYIHPSLSAQREACEKLEGWYLAIAGFSDAPAQKEQKPLTGF